MFEIGRGAALFADDMEVQKKLRDFYSAVQSQNVLQRDIVARQQTGAPNTQEAGRVEAASFNATGLLVSVLKEMSRSANFPVQSLSDSETRSIFTLGLANPAGVSTLIVNAQQASQILQQPPQKI